MEAVETLHEHGKLLLNHYSFNSITIAVLATLAMLATLCYSLLCYLFMYSYFGYTRKSYFLD